MAAAANNAGKIMRRYVKHACREANRADALINLRLVYAVVRVEKSLHFYATDPRHGVYGFSSTQHVVLSDEKAAVREFADIQNTINADRGRR